MDYEQFYENQCLSLLDTRHFFKIMDNVVSAIQDEKCCDNTKILFGEWMFTKIFSLTILKELTFKTVVENLKMPIDRCEHIILKASYLEFINRKAVIAFCLHFYEKRFSNLTKPDVFLLQLLNDKRLLEYYQNESGIAREELRVHFIDWITEEKSDAFRSNILDVLIRNFKDDPDVLNIKDQMQWGNKKLRNPFQKTIHDDAQNAHDETLSEEYLKACKRLLDWKDFHPVEENGQLLSRAPSEWISDQLDNHFDDMFIGFQKKYPKLSLKQQKKKMEKVLHMVKTRAAIDGETFGSGFRISDILFATIHYINETNSNNLWEILGDEMDAMHDLCASAYIERLMNAFQGVEEMFAVTLPFSIQLHTKVSQILSDAFMHASDDVIKGSELNEEFEQFYFHFIKVNVEKNLTVLYSQYGKKDVLKEICSVLDKFTNNRCQWKCSKNNVLTFEPCSDS